MTMARNTAPYGSWKSPITSDLIVSQTINFHHVVADGSDIYWIEWRPSENGRYCIVRRAANGAIEDVTPAGFNVRCTVHEYGGAAYAVSNGVVYFSNYSDQHLYIQKPGNAPEILCKEAGMRYADAVVDQTRQRLICVREDHARAGEATNGIAGISLNPPGQAGLIVSGNDFYSNPRLSPDGKSLAWLTWHHPNMPWDGCELWVGEFADDGSIINQQLVAGGQEESIFQPEWSPGGVLYFISDRSGWWNLYRWNKDGQIDSLCKMTAEFGRPLWQFGYSTYTFATSDQIVCSYTKEGSWTLALLDTINKNLEPLQTGYADILWPRALPGAVVFKGGSPREAASIVLLDLATKRCEVLRKSTGISIDEGYISIPEPIEFPTEGGLTAHAFFYRPANQDFTAAATEKPPLLVKSHGGPTGNTSSTLSLEIQYWTSRGIAVLDVNYGGSTGYGTAYRRRLNGKWGITDVDDCVNGALFLVKRGDVDGERLLITGGSAGGYTTLCALTFHDVFKAGASHYGIGDLEAMVADTHKFESRYCDALIAPYPEGKDVYIERSPIRHIEKLSCPVVFFQGLEDKVVPPNQAEAMVEALKLKKIPVAYVPFPGEQHGFRKADTVKRALDGELYFYSRVLNFALADKVTPIEIDNLNS
jgi:dipeptidyl aminopeptidase/acylaminoacyl peptidase